MRPPDLRARSSSGLATGAARACGATAGGREGGADWPWMRNTETASARLRACVPKAEAFLEAAVRRGASPGVETRRLLALLRDYGAEPLAWAVEEAFARGTPRAASVHFLLETRRRSRRFRTAPPLDLRSRPELDQMHVTPHALETYDDLADSED